MIASKQLDESQRDSIRETLLRRHKHQYELTRRNPDGVQQVFDSLSFSVLFGVTYFKKPKFHSSSAFFYNLIFYWFQTKPNLCFNYWKIGNVAMLLRMNVLILGRQLFANRSFDCRYWSFVFPWEESCTTGSRRCVCYSVFCIWDFFFFY